ncbi:dTMP kinase [Methylocapsa sp. S129]|uniref:dTMP kinase n=1 Tax=Methylocapsa sp. S129 TaxID=1641869 RepID=UPI001577212A|nr:dTMP kinase [Methylocapsa sp. S129]
MSAPAKGRFITLEGGEGAGKSTQAQLLAQRLEPMGISVVVTREPGGSPGAEALRDVILSGKAAPFGPAGEAILFSAARIDHIDHTIAPALHRGAWVISDRFADSTRAYQGAAGKLDPALIASLERVAVGDVRPDLTLILDLPTETGLARAAARRGKKEMADRFEREDAAFHETLRQAFLDIARSEPERCAVIDADKSPQEVAEAIWACVRDRLASALQTESAPP